MGLHALVLYMNADVSILLVVLFTISVCGVNTWFLLVSTIFLMVQYLQLASFLHPSSIKHDLFGLVVGLYGVLREG